MEVLSLCADYNWNKEWIFSMTANALVYMFPTVASDTLLTY